MNFGKSSEDPASPVLVQAWPPASVGPGHSCSWPRLPSSGCGSLGAWSPGQASCKFYDSTTKGDLDRTGLLGRGVVDALGRGADGPGALSHPRSVGRGYWLFSPRLFGLMEPGGSALLPTPASQLVSVLAVRMPQKNPRTWRSRPGQILEQSLQRAGEAPGGAETCTFPQPSLGLLSFQPRNCDRSRWCFLQADRPCHHASGDEGLGTLVCLAWLCRKGLITN